METILFVAIFVPAFVALMFALSGDSAKAEHKARERRIAEHRMNARLLRFNI